jgi:hypothetical protein
LTALHRVPDVDSEATTSIDIDTQQRTSGLPCAIKLDTTQLKTSGSV